MFTEHPLRRELNDEVHARPPLRIEGPAVVLHLACLRVPDETAGSDGSDQDLRFIADLARHHGAPAPDPASRYGILPRGETQLKWERHTEFTSYTLVMPRPELQAGAAVWADLPADALQLAASCPGPCVAALVLEFRAATATDLAIENLTQLFPGGEMVGSRVGDGAAAVWTDFRIDAAGFGRLLMVNHSLTGGRAGRMVQRLLEIETYRLMALLGLALIRRSGATLGELEARLKALIERTAAPGSSDLAPSDDSDRLLLNELTRLAAECASLGAATRYRLSAGAAYAELVGRRLSDIREGRLEGLSRLSGFLERRFTPAMRTCEAFQRRLDQLETGIDRASDMLRTRVDVNLQAQNGALLRDMESRSRVQLRIQEAVEGLSVFAISYYLIGLLKIVAEGLLPHPEQHAEKWLAAIAVPIVLAAVWLGVRRLRRAIKGGASN